MAQIKPEKIFENIVANWEKKGENIIIRVLFLMKKRVKINLGGNIVKGSEESKISMYIEIEYDDFFQNSGSPITLLYSFNKVHKF